MKNIFKRLMLVAVAAMGFACQENLEGFTPERANEVVMTISAELDESTRTYISDEANGKIAWSEGDQLKVIENSAVYRTTQAATIAADGKAQFAVSFPANTSATEFTYDAIFPASAVVEDDAEKVNVEKIKVIVKDQQKPTATSFDPQADVLVANQLVFDAQPTELNMQFKRLVALGKMTIKGLPEDAEISQVVFTAGANDGVAGRNYVNATTGKVLEYGYYGKTNTLTLTYDAPIATRDIYFVCNPFEMATGDKFSVVVKSGDDTYATDVEIPAERSLVFTEGNMSTFSVTVAKQEVSESAWMLVTDVNDLAVGDEIIIAAKSANYAISTTQNSNNRAQAAITKVDDTVTFGDAVQVLTLETGSVADTYAFNTGSGYLYAASASKNYLRTQDNVDANASWKIEIASTGVATIKAQGTNTRNWLRYNSTNNPPIFACYGSGQADVVIYKNYAISGGDEPEVETYNIYLKNEDNWDEVYFYAWGEYATSDWPGEAMTKTTVEGEEYYVYNLPAEATGKTLSFLFNNNNNGKQTADITGVVADKDYFFTNYVEPAVTETYLYLKPNANWKVDGARFAAYFFGAGETWVDATLVEGETDIYSVAAPAGYPNVIFCRMNPGATANNWNNKWNQTADLTVPTDGTNFYTVKEGTWDNGGGTWSTYTPAVVALDAPEVTVAVDVNVITLTWNAVAGAKHYTVQVDDDVVENVDETSYSFVGDYEVEYMFTIKAIAADTTKNSDSEAVVVTAKTEVKPADTPVDNTLTVAEFLALTDVVASDATAEEIAAAPRYTLTGTITSVTNTSYGNFYLNDGTGEVLIYGLVGPNGETKYWANSGAKVGDDITVETIRTEYSNSPQGKNATFVELKTPGTLAFWVFDASAASFTAAGGEKTIKLDIYNTSSEVVATSDNAQFSAAYANGTLTIAALENTTFEAIEGNVTVTCGTLSQVIPVSQAAASQSGDEQTEVTAELKFVAANRTSWNTSQQTWEANGIKLVNDKGSSTSNVADYVNPARFYKSSKITVTAPGNITTIVFDCNSSSYATALESSIKTGTISVSSDKVTVTLDGSSNEFVISSLTGGQVRMDSMTVTYLN